MQRRRGRVGRQSRCKKCANERRWENGRFIDEGQRQRVYQTNRASYHRNPTKVLNKQAKWRLNAKEKLGKRKVKALSLMAVSVCMRCGYDHPAALQFHHRDPTTKTFNISTKLHQRTEPDWDEIKLELEKCDVLCSNCHDLEHFGACYEWWKSI